MRKHQVFFRTLLTAIVVLATAVTFISRSSVSAAFATPWYPGGSSTWSYRKPITIDRTKVSGGINLTSFPVLMSLTDPDLRTIAFGGHVALGANEFVFTAGDGITAISHEIEKYDPATGQLITWVNVPALSITTDTVLYVYYGDSSGGPSHENIPGTWNSNYKGVWHLPNGSTLSAKDSTSTGNNGTISGATATTGKIYGGGYFVDLNNDNIDKSSATMVDNTFVTLSAWVNMTIASSKTIFDLLNGSTALQSFGIAGGNRLRFFQSHNGVGPNGAWETAIGDISPNTVYHVAVTYDRSSTLSKPTFYINGVLKPIVAGNQQPGNIRTGSNRLRIAGAGIFDGMIDEVRLSNVLRAAGWIQTEYSNQQSPSTFYAVGGEETIPPPDVTPPIISNVNVLNITQSTADISWQTDELSDSQVEFLGPCPTTGCLRPLVSTPTTNHLVNVSDLVPDTLYPFRVLSRDAAGNLATSPQSSFATDAASTPTSYRKPITIDHTKVSGGTDLYDFPVLISVTDPDLRTISFGGKVALDSSEFVLTASDASAILNYEVEKYDPATGQLIVWVKVPTVSATTDTLVYLYYGNPSPGLPRNPPGTWDQNYKSVWHLPDGSSLSANDSTSNGNNGTNIGVAATTGKIDGGGFFVDSENDMIDKSTAVAVDNNQVTISGWINMTTAGTKMIVELLNGSTAIQSFMIVGGNRIRLTQVHNGSAPNGAWETAIGDITANTLYHVAVTYDRSSTANKPVFYINGVQKTIVATNQQPGNIKTGSNRVRIAGAGLFDGMMDEIRISNVIRGAGWIQTEYRNQNSPATFYTVGGEEESPTPVLDTAPPVISTVTASNITQSTATISWDTDEPADSQVEFFGPCPSGGCLTPLISATTVSHTVNVSGLAASTTYPFRVKSRDAAGNLAVSTPGSFETQAPPSPNAILEFASYFGGSEFDTIRGIAVDVQGHFYITGGTVSPNLPTTPGVYQPAYSGGTPENPAIANVDIFIAKFDQNCTLIWSTYLGGPNYDRAYSVEVDNQGYVYVAGRAGKDFPITTGSFQDTFTGGGDNVFGNQDGFVAKLTPDGSQLVWSSYFGTNDIRIIRDMTVDSNKDVYIASGYTSGAYPPAVATAFINSPLGGDDAVFAKIKSDGSQVLWARYSGGAGLDNFQNQIRVDAQDNPYGLFSTLSSGIATAGAYDTTYGGNADLFVTKLNPATGATVWGTYFGGSDNESTETHQLAVDTVGNVYITGPTKSTDLETTVGAFQRTYGGGLNDMFVAKISSDGSQLLASTYLGGSVNDRSEGIRVDGAGRVYVTGNTGSPDFPITPDAHQAVFGGANDIAIIIFSSDLSQLIYGSFLGGPNYEGGRTVGVGNSGDFYFGGEVATGFPTKNAFQPTFGGYSDAFMAKVHLINPSAAPAPPKP